MGTSSYIYAIGKRTLAAIVCALTLLGCDSVIYDGEGDCSVNYRVKFRYDMNLKFADAFAHEVESVTLYLLDGGRVVWQRTESGEALGKEGYAMEVDVAPGTYDLLAWCGSTDKGSFRIPESASGKELTCTLMRESGTDGTGHVREDLDRLYHGYLPNQTFGDTEGTYTYVVPLVKNTNNVRVVLQQTSGERLDEKRFSFRITAENGRMDWDNQLLPDEPVTYHAWHKQSATAGTALPDLPDAVTSVNAVIAELTTARLMVRDKSATVRAETGTNPPQLQPEELPEERKMRLTVRDNDTGKTVLSIPLVDYALLVKGEYRRDMDEQEFLDRMDEYNIVCVLGEGMRWVSMSINIHSWKMVWQNTGI